MAVRTSVEVERTYDFPPSVAPPDLLGIAGITSVRRHEDERLDATYYDTHDLRLARAGITLRRRRGGRDAGWHLKLPIDRQTREEVTLPPGRGAAVPAELRTLVRSRTRLEPLRPMVRLRTHRTVHQLLGADGRILAELAEDRVTGELLSEPGHRTVWREMEVELVDGDPAGLDGIGARLEAAGAVLSPWPSKLARTLGSRLPGPPAPLRRKPTAGEAVLHPLREQLSELAARDPDVRRDRPDAVHKMRVATRRLRSALKAARPLLDRAATDPLRAELKHLAGVLAVARDAEVMRDYLIAEVAGLPADLVVGPVRARIEDDLGAQYRLGRERAVEELDTDRFLRLLDAFDRLLAEPAFRDRAGRPAAPELRALVRRSVHHLHKADSAVRAAPTPRARDELLHEVRKSAKQVRYTAELAVGVLGRDAAGYAGLVEQVQKALGDHQDSVVVRTKLRELALQADLAGEDGFTFGLLYGRQFGRAAQAEADYTRAWKRAARRPAQRWLD